MHCVTHPDVCLIALCLHMFDGEWQSGSPAADNTCPDRTSRTCRCRTRYLRIDVDRASRPGWKWNRGPGECHRVQGRIQGRLGVKGRDCHKR